MIPWWAYLYLAVLGLLTFGGIIEELKKLGGMLYALGTFISFVIIAVFIISYFHQAIASSIGLFSVPMLLVVLFYDFYLSEKNLILGSKHFGEPMEEIKSRMDLLTASLIVAPGYLTGLYICYRALTSG